MSRRTVVAVAAMMALGLGGAAAIAIWTGLRGDAPPERLRITVTAPGLDPLALDRQVAYPLAVALAEAAPETRVDLVAGDGAVTALLVGPPDPARRQRVTERLAELELPPAADSPWLTPAGPLTVRWALEGGDAPSRAEALALGIGAVPGARSVDTCAPRDEIRVEVARSAAHGLTALEVADALASGSADPVGGRVAAGDLILGRAADPWAQLGERTVGSRQGMPLRLIDVASIERRPAEDGCVCVHADGGCASGVASVDDRAALERVRALVQEHRGQLLEPVACAALARPERTARAERLRVGVDLARRAQAIAGSRVVVVVDGSTDPEAPACDVALFVASAPDPSSEPDADGALRAALVAVAGPRDVVGRGPRGVVRLAGDDREALVEHARAVAEEARRAPGIAAAVIDGAATTEAVRVEIDRERAAQLGVSDRDVARAVALSTSGENVMSVVDGPGRLDVRVHAGGGEELGAMRVPAAGGGAVLLSEVATLRRERQPRRLHRCGVTPCVRVHLEAEPGASSALADARDRILDAELPPGIRATWAEPPQPR